jgi:hypothetical protein
MDTASGAGKGRTVDGRRWRGTEGGIDKLNSRYFQHFRTHGSSWDDDAEMCRRVLGAVQLYIPLGRKDESSQDGRVDEA